MGRRNLEPRNTALLVIDMQPDFMPGGALEVPQGDQIVPGIASLMDSDRFAFCVATQDWHPPDHLSFATQHPNKQAFDTIEICGSEQTLWPDHCVQGTPGAELYEHLPWDKVAAFIRKGMDPKVDSYSGFRNNISPDGTRPSTGLTGYLQERGIENVCVCGLARDVCAMWTAEDAVQEGGSAYFLWDLTRAVMPSADADTQHRMEGAGVEVMNSSEL